MLVQDNTPGAGSVTWSDFEITHQDITYEIDDDNSDKKFIWWDFTTPTVFLGSDTMPTLTQNDCIVMYNDSGTHYLWGDWRIHGALILDGTIPSPAIGDLYASAIETEIIGTPTYDNLQDWLNNTMSSGYFSGGVITATSPADGTIAISAVTGFIKTTDDELGVTKSFNLAGTTAFALTNNSTNYIYIWYDSGTPKFAVTTTRTDIKDTWMFTLGRVYREDDVVHIVNSGINLANFIRDNHERLVSTRGFERASGGTIAETGERYLESQAGVFYLGQNKATTTGVDTSGAATFMRHYHSSGVWTHDDKSQIAEGGAGNYKYDNGTDLANVSNNKYGVYWAFIHFDGDLHVVVGRGDYTLAEAQEASVPALPDSVSNFATLAAKIVLLEDGTNFTSVESAYTQVFPTSQPVNHNDLSLIQGGAADDYYHLTQVQHAIASSPEVTGQFIFTVTGELVAENNATLELFAAASLTLTEVFISVKTAPTDANIIVDVNKNGTTIFTDQGKRPEIVATATSDTSDAPDVTAIVKNDKLTIDIDQIGSTLPGENLTVHVRFTQAVT